MNCLCCAFACESTVPEDPYGKHKQCGGECDDDDVQVEFNHAVGGADADWRDTVRVVKCSTVEAASEHGCEESGHGNGGESGGKVKALSQSRPGTPDESDFYRASHGFCECLRDDVKARVAGP